jgi:hypothetical protein
MTPTEALPSSVVEHVRARRPFKTPSLIGYLTKGGTYILASSGLYTDSGKPNDLMAVLPAELDHGRVLPLYIATNPEVVAYLEAQLREG